MPSPPTQHPPAPDDRRVHVLISPDKLTASVRLEAGLTTDNLNEASLNALLDQRGVVASAERDAAVRALITLYFSHHHDELIVPVAHGTPAVHGIDGRLDLTPDALVGEAQAPEPRETPGAAPTSIDHRARRNVRWVRGGTCIARIVPPIDGCDGRDVLGAVVRARPARPLPLAKHDSISVLPDGAVLAMHDGVVRHDGAARLVVDRTLTIDQNVGFATGHVHYPGDVVIEQGVADRFEVRVGGDLTVHNLVDAAVLDAAGSIVLAKGMAGRGLGTLRAGRDVRSPYLTGVTGSVGRDVELTHELTDCTLTIGRQLLAPLASLVRGEVSLARGGELGELGAAAGVRTLLRLGHHPSLEPLAKRLAQLHTSTKRALEQTDAELNSLAAQGSQDPATQLRRTQLIAAQRAAQGQLGKMIKAFVTLWNAQDRYTASELVVRGCVHPGATLALGGLLAEATRPLRGPVQVLLSPAGEPLVKDLSSGKVQPMNRCGFRILPDPKAVALAKLGEELGIDPEAAAFFRAAG